MCSEKEIKKVLSGYVRLYLHTQAHQLNFTDNESSSFLEYKNEKRHLIMLIAMIHSSGGSLESEP